MKPQVFAMLGLRLLAVLIAAQSLVFLAEAAIYFVFRPGGMPPPAYFVAFWLLGPFVVAIALWWVAPYLARLASRGIPAEPAVRISTQALVGATLVAAGILIFITALPGLTTDVLRFYFPPNRFLLPELTGKALQCILGIGLVVGSGTASKLLLRLRYAGTQVPDL